MTMRESTGNGTVERNDLVEVSKYVNNYVLQSYIWDNSDVKVRTKAINRAKLTINTLLADVFINREIPIHILGEQAMWVMKLDDTIERAELGMKNVWVDGTMITVNERDNSICPLVYKLLGISTTAKGTRRKTGSYNHPVGGTGRWGAGSQYTRRY